MPCPQLGFTNLPESEVSLELQHSRQEWHGGERIAARPMSTSVSTFNARDCLLCAPQGGLSPLLLLYVQHWN